MSRQHHKGKKRPRNWHRQFAGPDRQFRRAVGRLDKAMKEHAMAQKLTPEEAARCAVTVDGWDYTVTYPTRELAQRCITLNTQRGHRVKKDMGLVVRYKLARPRGL